MHIQKWVRRGNRVLFAWGTVVVLSMPASAQEQAMFLVPGLIQEAVKTETVTLTCPRDGKLFQIQMNKENPAFQKGTLRVICPYDGYVFYPSGAALEGKIVEKEELFTVRCPVDGREFQAELNIQEIVKGTSGQVLKCPYDGTEFRVSLQSLTTKQLGSELNMSRFQDSIGRIFGARMGEDQAVPLYSPFDGSKAMLPKEDLGMPMGLDGEDRELSRIEEMFAGEAPLHVSRSLKQFGYDLFPSPKRFLPQGDAALASFTGMAPQASQTVSTDYAMQQTRMPGRESFLSQLLGVQPFSTFQSASSSPVGPNYVLGPDDTLVINVWGGMEGTFPVTVDRDGKIMLPKAGPVYVWGLRFEEVEDLIQQSLSQHFSNVRISVTMGRLRTIRVFVLGEVKRPGAYIISAQSTLLHALYAAYGPTKMGSLRQIKLLHDDKTEEVIDLYELLIKGNKDADRPLQSNDTIMISPIGPVVGIAGGVKRPAIYELSGPTSLEMAMRMAGGETAIGYVQRIQVERIFQHERKVVQDLEFDSIHNLHEKQEKIHIQDGDFIIVYAINPLRRNFVTITGNVERPGDYELKDKMRLLDLIEKAGGFLPGTYFSRAEVSRFTTDRKREIITADLEGVVRGDQSQNVLLREWDVIKIFSRGEFLPIDFVEISGAVDKPGRFDLKEQMKVSDLFFRAGGAKSNASLERAELVRISEKGHMEVLLVNLEKILAKEADDFYLKGGDALFVRQVQATLGPRSITLRGEVRYPGEYRLRPGERLSSVLRRAGGFTEYAFLEGIIFNRKTLKEAQKRELQRFFDDEYEARLQEHISLGEGFSENYGLVLPKRNEHREKFLENFESSEFLGRLPVKITDIEGLEGSKYDVLLEDGDRLFVPQVPSSIQVIGNVFNPGFMLFQEGKFLKEYLRDAGGFKKGADREQIYVMHANGEVESRFVRLKKIQRGDTIIVPEKITLKANRRVWLRDTASLLYQLGLGVALATD